MSKRYVISFDLDAEDIMDAYAKAREVNLRAVDLVAQRKAHVTRVGMRWAVTIDARAPSGRRSEVTVAFDGERRDGGRVIVDTLSLNGEPIPQATSAYLVSAGDLAQLVRSMAIFPLDLLDAMADADERRRRGDGGRS